MRDYFGLAFVYTRSSGFFVLLFSVHITNPCTGHGVCSLVNMQGDFVEAQERIKIECPSCCYVHKCHLFGKMSLLFTNAPHPVYKCHFCARMSPPSSQISPLFTNATPTPLTNVTSFFIFMNYPMVLIKISFALFSFGKKGFIQLLFNYASQG